MIWRLVKQTSDDEGSVYPGRGYNDRGVQLLQYMLSMMRKILMIVTLL